MCFPDHKIRGRSARGGARATESCPVTFAVSDPGVDVGRYGLRWGIES